jgi:hypothetical protein
MQAREARPPFAGLRTRVEGFEREELADALRSRQIVRAAHARDLAPDELARPCATSGAIGVGARRSYSTGSPTAGGRWKRKKAAASLVITPFESLPRAAVRALVSEAEAVLRFLDEDASTFDVRLAA